MVLRGGGHVVLLEDVPFAVEQVGERRPPHIGAHVVQNHIRQPDEPFRPVESCSRGGECGECGRRAPALERPPSTRGRSCSLLAPRGGAHRSRWWSAWETTGAAVRGQASKFAPPSNMGRGLTHTCHHVSTPILAAAIISRDVRVANQAPDLIPHPAWRPREWRAGTIAA